MSRVTDLLVIGFIRQNYILINIPHELIDLCLMFHHIKFTISKPPIIIHNGSYLIKYESASTNNDKIPFQIPTVIGEPKYKNDIIFMMMNMNKILIGDEAVQRRGILKLIYPLKCGVITNWEHMKEIWKYVFHIKLKIDPQERVILLTEKALNPKQNKQQLIKIMFETLNVYGMCLIPDCILSLYATGRRTGIIVDFGYEITEIVPIYNNAIISDAIFTLNIGGKHITEYFIKLCEERGYSFSSISEKKEAKRVKEITDFVYVALDYNEELLKAKTTSDIERNVEWENISIVTFGAERFKATECLFKPNLIGLEKEKGIHEILFLSIMKCNTQIRKQLFENIIICGGPSMHNGLDNRLKKELKLFVSDTDTLINIDIILHQKRKHLSWIGGNIISLTNQFQQNCISKDEYNIYGPSIVDKKKLKI